MSAKKYMKRNTMWLLVVTTLFMTGCSTAGYYAQSIKGQMEIWTHARPISTVLEDPDVPGQVKKKLQLALDVRRFAVEQMFLPDNDSYTEFVDLKRHYVVWSVFAAPELSLEAVEWCFLVVGCVTYRGYFEQQSAVAFARQTADQGFDTYVGGVPAYSTLGWFDDPVPNTVLNYTEEDFAGLIFHELAHQVAFAKGDTMFNESFATTVEHLGVEMWLQHAGDPSRWEAYRLRKQRDQKVVDLILAYRTRLEEMYASESADQAKRHAKERLIGQMQNAYTEMTAPWQPYAGYKRWFDEPINNAKMISVATYNQLIPAFEKLLDEHGGDLTAFYEAAQALAGKPKPERHELLASL